MLNIKWKIVDQDFANFELSSTQLRLAAGDAGDSYLCGNCGNLLAQKIPRDVQTVRKSTKLNGIPQNELHRRAVYCFIVYFILSNTMRDRDSVDIDDIMYSLFCYVDSNKEFQTREELEEHVIKN